MTMIKITLVKSHKNHTIARKHSSRPRFPTVPLLIKLMEVQLIIILIISALF